MDNGSLELNYAPIRRHAARPHRLRGQHRASLADELAPLFSAEQRRYAAVVSTAVIGASAVAIGSAAALPDESSNVSPTSERGTSYQFIDSEDDIPAIDVSSIEEELATVLNTSEPESEERDDPVEADVSDEPSEVDPSPIAEQPPQSSWHRMVDEVSLTSLFGPRWGRLHNGIDLGGSHGTPIYAVQSGVVTKADWSGGFGKLVVIDHGNGVESYYAHASAMHVSPGDEVEGGQHIMDMGNTGFSFGDHLHFEVHVDGEPVDPVPFLDELGLELE